MKCVNCGADFESRDLCCPYCGTTNQLGHEWTKEENDAYNRMNLTKKYIMSSLPLYVCDHVCNIIIGIGALFIIILFLILNVSFGDKNKEPNYKKADVEYMEDCFQRRDSYALIEYMNKYHLRNDKEQRFKKYTEYVELSIAYEKVVEMFGEFQNASVEEIETRCEYGVVSNAISYGNRYLAIYLGYQYRSGDVTLEPENQAIYDRDKEFIAAYLETQLLLTKSECNLLMENEIYGEELQQLVEKVYQRKGWRYQANEE